MWALVLLLSLAALGLRLRGRSLPLRVPFGHRSSAAPAPNAPQGVTREAAVDSVSHAVQDVQLSSASLQHALAALPAPSPMPPGWFEAAAPWTAPPGTNFTYQGLHDKLTALLSVQASPAGWVSILTMSAGIKVPSGVPACKQRCKGLALVQAFTCHAMLRRGSQQTVCIRCTSKCYMNTAFRLCLPA